MQERKDLGWEEVLERAKMPPRQVDNRVILGIIIIAGLSGFTGSTAAIEFAKRISEVYQELLVPPASFLLQFSATGFGALLGAGIGFSVERYIAEGEI